MGLALPEGMGNEADEHFDLWPEHVECVRLFVALSTQWHVAPNGAPYALRYDAAHQMMGTLGVKKRRRAEVFAQLQAMERVALDVWSAS